MRIVGLTMAFTLAISVVAGAAAANPGKETSPFPKALPEEPIPSIQSLPAAWPAAWVLIHDFHFSSIVDGRVMLVDTTSEDQPLKGIVRAAQFANMLVSPRRGEVLTVEQR